LSKIQTNCVRPASRAKRKNLSRLKRLKASTLWPVGRLSAGYSFDNNERYQADGKVHNHPKIDPEGIVAGCQRQIPRQQKVDCISSQNRRQRMNEIGHLFGHILGSDGILPSQAGANPPRQRRERRRDAQPKPPADYSTRDASC